MRATFALLANTEVHNVVRKLSWEIHQKYQTGTKHASLPPHISLKQTFSISDIAALEKYMDELAKSITPFDLMLTEVQVVPISFNGIDYGILWLDVEETRELRELHNRLNQELNESFGNTSADFDGDRDHFHMTAMMGGQPFEVYQKFLSEIPDPKVNLLYTVKELAMFVYDEPMEPESDYLCYRMLPIG